MKKITLKISAFLFLTMLAFQTQGQVSTETIYNLVNNGTGNYISSDNTNVYKAIPYDAANVGLNFTFHTVAGTDPVAYNINNQAFRGIMRGAGTKAVIHTTFQPDTNGALATDKYFNIETEEFNGETLYRFEIGSGGDARYLYEGTDGIYYNISIADMDSDDVAYSNGQDASWWALEESTIVLSTKSFGVDAFSISNPVNDQLTIKGATSKVKQISLYSVIGNKVLSKSVNNVNGDIKLNVNALSSGLYIVEMTGNDGQRFTKKIIKQ